MYSSSFQHLTFRQHLPLPPDCSPSCLKKMLNHMYVMTQWHLWSKKNPLMHIHALYSHRRDTHKHSCCIFLHTLWKQNLILWQMSPEDEVCSVLFSRTKSSFAQRAISLHKSDHRSLCTQKQEKHTLTEINAQKELRVLSTLLSWIQYNNYYVINTHTEIWSLCACVCIFSLFVCHLLTFYHLPLWPP